MSAVVLFDTPPRKEEGKTELIKCGGAYEGKGVENLWGRGAAYPQVKYSKSDGGANK